MSLAVTAATALTTRSAGAVGVAFTGFGGLFDALVGETIANVGFAVFAWAPTAIGAVLALGGWVLANAILANEPFCTVAFGRAVGVGHLAAAVNAILARGTSGGIAATCFTKAGISAVRISRAIGVFKAFELTNADTLVKVRIGTVAYSGTWNIAAIVRYLI